MYTTILLLPTYGSHFPFDNFGGRHKKKDDPIQR